MELPARPSLFPAGSPVLCSLLCVDHCVLAMCARLCTDKHLNYWDPENLEQMAPGPGLRAVKVDTVGCEENIDCNSEVLFLISAGTQEVRPA